MTQEEVLDLQKETYESVNEYLEKLIPSMNGVITELEGDMKEDTWEYLRMILDGLNWVIQAFNGILDYVDPDNTKFNVKNIDESIKQLSDVYANKDAVKIAIALKNDIVPFLSQLKDVK